MCKLDLEQESVERGTNKVVPKTNEKVIKQYNI